MKIIARAAFAAALLWVGLAAPPAEAQFSAQATYAGTATGTANAIALAINNWTRNYPGVPITFIPLADNTGAATVIVNGFGSPISVKKPANTGLAALSGGEIRTGQLTTVVYDGTQFILQGQLGKYTNSSTLSNSTLSYGAIGNLQLNATVGTNALTIAVKTTSGADATATTPILIPFRSSTIANGAPNVAALGSSLSFTIASGSTMGCASGVMCRLWIVAICSSGLSCTGSAGTDVVGLCAFNARSGTSIAPINEAALQTGAAGTSGGSLAQTYYCNISSVTARAVRIIGYVDVQESSAGTWSSGPTYVQLFGPGIKKPGDVVQSGQFTTTTPTSSTSTTPTATALAGTINLTSAANVISLSAAGTVYSPNGGNNAAILQLYKNTGTTAIGNISTLFVGSGSQSTSVTHNIAVDFPAASSMQYGLYIKDSSSTTTFTFLDATVPGTNTGVLIWQEIMSSIEPANDNSRPLAMVG